MVSDRKRTIFDVLYRKQAFLDYENIGLKKATKLAFFQRGWSMVLVRKFFHLLCLSKVDREKVFPSDLDRKKAPSKTFYIILDNRIVDLSQQKNWPFPKGNHSSAITVPPSMFHHQCSISNIDSSNSDGYQKYLTGTDKRFQLHPTSTNKVLSLLNRLNRSKAAGLDKISARLIRECADLICIPIRDIFNQSISQGIFPDDWKCAKVTPLFKQGDRDDLNNYRPISVISVMAKVFERIVYDQLYAYLEEHNIICKYQSGFRAIHSTVTALLEATDTWAYNIDRGKINVVVFLDLRKAFDTVDHEILLSN